MGQRRGDMIVFKNVKWGLFILLLLLTLILIARQATGALPLPINDLLPTEKQDL